MKKLILAIILLIFTASNIAALTIDATGERDTLYETPTMVRGSFGKLRSSGEYGIYIYIDTRSEDRERRLETFFFRLDCTVERVDNYLHAIIDGNKIILAEKKWYGWKRADGVLIKYRVEGSPYATVDAWLEIE